MTLKIIEKSAEKELVILIEEAKERNIVLGVLALYFSTQDKKPTSDDLLATLKVPIHSAKDPRMYVCSNHDIYISWGGLQKEILRKLLTALKKFFGKLLDTVPGSHKYFDSNVDGKELLDLLKQRIDTLPTLPEQDITVPVVFNWSEHQKLVFKNAQQLRKLRTEPEILIVEDQPFSSKLLQEVLGSKYITSIAEDFSQVETIYTLRAPDIIFLDINLPGMNGHEIAKNIKKLDPAAFIVMLTANNHLPDIQAAKENGANGFVLKPYNKQKIINCIENYFALRKNVARSG